ncbi:oligoribonuclease [Candidatus Acetothermia bacterium]|jgi:oligoribonuclease|nr:oligoribonuclease [Candidatus Acetothermia bacterium]MCI2426004.1 oligoribonuclease [Candidatus Acetothermia bacterium]MCI2427132.1 oligoribonuclease [Candidatus Acetothermia bacterium]MCI2428964.1 oligoribonuclease [Candidatus Acetothermia bacterium]
MSKQDPNNLVWLDLETTGLDPDTCVILEIATIITDKDLNIIAEGPDLAIHQPEGVLVFMDEWCEKQHRISGLIEASRNATISLAEAEQETIAFVSRYCPPRACPLCGNSICFDRRFLIKHMSKLDAFLSYRNIDVSSIKELVSRWYIDKTIGSSKTAKHRAIADIRESIEELRSYRKTVFRQAEK